jgi:carotenoid cleavage oxygenase
MTVQGDDMTTFDTRRGADNPYLQGMMAPVEVEVTAVDLEVSGTVPEHLNGRYLRNGANPAAEVDPATYHWFSGDAMVHGLALRDGKALWYRNRWVRTPAVCRALGEARGRAIDPRAGMLAVGQNTNVLTHAGKTLAMVEGGGANYELTEELDTIGTCDFDGTLHGGYTAHPHRDPKTKELHAISYSFARANTVQYSVIDAYGQASRTLDIEVTGAPMMHDFSLTERYVVIYDLPVTFDPVKMAPRAAPRWLHRPARMVLEAMVGRVKVPDPISVLVNRNTKTVDAMPFAWNPSYPARIGVLPRGGNNEHVRWFEIEPCYVFHPLNAYSERRNDEAVVVLDVVRNERMFDRGHHGPNEGHPTLDRWTINLTTGAVRTERRDDRTQEFPRINETLTGRRHRYGYTNGVEGGCIWDDKPGLLKTAVYKHDYATGGCSTAPLPPDLVVGEMSFVPNPGARDEDDGVLMGYGYHRGRAEGQLLILDAASLETMATVHLPQRVPMGFHGNWVPAQAAGGG